MLGRRRPGTTGTPLTTTLPQGTWEPWTATIGRLLGTRSGRRHQPVIDGNRYPTPGPGRLVPGRHDRGAIRGTAPRAAHRAGAHRRRLPDRHVRRRGQAEGPHPVPRLRWIMRLMAAFGRSARMSPAEAAAVLRAAAAQAEASNKRVAVFATTPHNHLQILRKAPDTVVAAIEDVIHSLPTSLRPGATGPPRHSWEAGCRPSGTGLTRRGRRAVVRGWALPLGGPRG
jgi:hypothetical protein